MILAPTRRELRTDDTCTQAFSYSAILAPPLQNSIVVGLVGNGVLLSPILFVTLQLASPTTIITKNNTLKNFDINLFFIKIPPKYPYSSMPRISMVICFLNLSNFFLSFGLSSSALLYSFSHWTLCFLGLYGAYLCYYRQ